jgi:hypothetical protein
VSNGQHVRNAHHQLDSVRAKSLLKTSNEFHGYVIRAMEASQFKVQGIFATFWVILKELASGHIEEVAIDFRPKLLEAFRRRFPLPRLEHVEDEPAELRFATNKVDNEWVLNPALGSHV